MQVTNSKKFIRFLVVAALFVIVAILGIVATIGGWTIRQSGELIVLEGATAEQVWQTAVEQGFTSGRLPWRFYAWRLNADAQIKSGTYQLNFGEHVGQVVQRLIAGDRGVEELTITFPEGFTLQQIAERVAARGIGTVDSFLAVAQPNELAQEFNILQGIPAGRDLEGYLFPDTYRVFIDDEPLDVIKRQLATLEMKIAEAGLTDEFLSQTGRTVDQILIMASIIEREVQADEDMALVSGVLWKRFDEGVGLDADATVRYALKKPTAALTVQDLANNSPYNTRKFRGLPPGPISNPGLRAIVAAARPADSDYYYYLNAATGETIFSRTNDEHNLNKARYLR